MFLGAGSVMHAMDDDVDMRHYGGLRKAVPITFLTFAMGYLAIIGFPGFSGFWSKDKIIEAAFGENLWIGLAALAGAGITAFYMTRLMILTFLSEKRWSEGVHPHESPKVMTIPLMVLAALSVLGGLLLLGGWITEWLSPVVGAEEHHALPLEPIVYTLIVTAVVAVGVLVAWLFVAKRDIPREAPRDVKFPVRFARNDLYGDRLNEAVLMRPGDRMVGGLVTFDDRGVDGLVDGTGAATMGMSGAFAKIQTGYVRSYALSLLAGALIVVLALLAVNFA
jgi:NADH-quinone oxidoreductase subunit L